MGVQENGDAAAAQVLEQQADGAPADGVERRGRLVEQEQARLADERLRDPEPLLHALRHPVDTAVGGVGERHELEQAAALGGAATRARKPLVQLEHLVRAVPAREAEELRQIAERRACGARAGARTGNLGLAFRLPHETDRDLHERRLAGAVRSEQPEELALADHQIDTFQSLHGPVAFLEAADGESSSHSPSVSPVVCKTVPRGYAEGPAAEEAERLADEASRRRSTTTRSRRRIPPSTAARPTTRSRTSSAGATRSTRTRSSRPARRGASRFAALPQRPSLKQRPRAANPLQPGLDQPRRASRMTTDPCAVESRPGS